MMEKSSTKPGKLSGTEEFDLDAALLCGSVHSWLFHTKLDFTGLKVIWSCRHSNKYSNWIMSRTVQGTNPSIKNPTDDTYRRRQTRREHHQYLSNWRNSEVQIHEQKYQNLPESCLLNVCRFSLCWETLRFGKLRWMCLTTLGHFWNKTVNRSSC